MYALNDIDVKAPAEVVWKLLVDAENWVELLSCRASFARWREETAGMVVKIYGTRCAVLGYSVRPTKLSDGSH
jgi:carbon monoxide dehydrogenase subunit G